MHWIMWCNPVHHIQRTLYLCSSGLLDEAQVEEGRVKKNLTHTCIKKLIKTFMNLTDERPRLRTEADFVKSEEAGGSSSTAPLPMASAPPPPPAVGTLINTSNVAVDADFQPPANSQGVAAW